MRIDCCTWTTPLQEAQARRERKLALEGPEPPGAAGPATPGSGAVRADASPLSPGVVTALAGTANDEPTRRYPGRYPANAGHAAGGLDLSF